MDRPFSAFGQAHSLPGRGPPPQHANYPQYNYSNQSRPCRDGYPPNLDHALRAAELHWTTAGNFDQHIKIYLLRYHDFYIETARFPEARAISNSAIQELAEELTQHQPVDQSALRWAAVKLLCNNYTRCQMPESAAAVDSLRGWDQYLNAHLDIGRVARSAEQEYQNTLAAHAESKAAALWESYRDFSRDPMKWANEYAWQEKKRVERQLEIAGNAAHQFLVQEKWPDLAEPAPPILKLHPEADEFIPSDSGYSSPSRSDGKQDPVSKVTTEPPRPSPKCATVEDCADDDLEFVDGGRDNATRNTACKETVSENEDSQHHTSIASLSPRVGQSSKNPSYPASLDMKKCFEHTIVMFSKSKEEIPVKALFDTGCQGPNWVSRGVVQKLGKELRIFAVKDECTFLAADGEHLRPLGIIELHWVFPDPDNQYGGNNWRHETFNVLPSNHIQVIFGADYCRDNDYVQFNEQAIAPLTRNRKPSDALKQQMADEKKHTEEARKKADQERIKVEKKLEAALAAQRGNQSGKKHTEEARKTADQERTWVEKKLEAALAAQRGNQSGKKRR